MGFDKKNAIIFENMAVNEITPPFEHVRFCLMLGKCISNFDELKDFAEQLKMTRKMGAWHDYNGEKIGKGLAHSVTWLVNHTESASDNEHQIRVPS